PQTILLVASASPKTNPPPAPSPPAFRPAIPAAHLPCETRDQHLRSALPSHRDQPTATRRPTRRDRWAAPTCRALLPPGKRGPSISAARPSRSWPKTSTIADVDDPARILKCSPDPFEFQPIHRKTTARALRRRPADHLRALARDPRPN